MHEHSRGQVACLISPCTPRHPACVSSSHPVTVEGVHAHWREVVATFRLISPRSSWHLYHACVSSSHPGCHGPLRQRGSGPSLDPSAAEANLILGIGMRPGLNAGFGSWMHLRCTRSWVGSPLDRGVHPRCWIGIVDAPEMDRLNREPGCLQAGSRSPLCKWKS